MLLTCTSTVLVFASVIGRDTTLRSILIEIVDKVKVVYVTSVTRLGDSLPFGLLFESHYSLVLCPLAKVFGSLALYLG